MLIGAWQLISGMILTFQFKDRLRAKYLIGAVAYLIFIFLGPIGGSGMSAFLQAFIIPAAIAIWYFGITYRDSLNAKAQLESFWDLKF